MNRSRTYFDILIGFGQEMPTETMSPDVLEEEEIDDGSDTPCQVIVYNDEIHSIGEVVHQIKKATGDDDNTAFEKTMTIHEKGSCIVFEGDKPDCVKVKSVLEEIQLNVEIKES